MERVTVDMPAMMQKLEVFGWDFLDPIEQNVLSTIFAAYAALYVRWHAAVWR